MTLAEATQNVIKFNQKSIHNEDEEFVYLESLDFIIKTTNDPSYMMELGGYHYECKNFDLALKYYEMAELLDYEPAYGCLGYVWYYGRTGVKDYKKAFYYFSKSSEKGNIISTYKLADMYKNGYGVDKDYEKYRKIIEDLYDNMPEPTNYHAPIPEIYTRLAGIFMKDGRNDEALMLLEQAKDFFATRMTYSNFFGNFTIMKFLIYDFYKLTNIDYDNFDFYDLYVILKDEHIVSFKFKGKKYKIESIKEDNIVSVNFEGKWYKDVDDFILKSCIDDKPISELYFDLYDFSIIK